eukprot:CAMPEP_0180687238 /NCGR_PEP_ID=MMETSP1037_2-20121125/73361_1 /TAXON_ID=632150 /ORGANISM="Azadinium spinosum, Strain 3D9" /LENGTH=41 /DNA_ID= /DNA_START= /DNA_END= /DNA_ORIENTATION=
MIRVNDFEGHHLSQMGPLKLLPCDEAIAVNIDDIKVAGARS